MNNIPTDSTVTFLWFFFIVDANGSNILNHIRVA